LDQSELVKLQLLPLDMIRRRLTPRKESITLKNVIEINNKRNGIPAKGQNETLGIVNPLEHTRAATDAVDGHVPENGGT
jgi:hypothetical protein